MRIKDAEQGLVLSLFRERNFRQINELISNLTISLHFPTLTLILSPMFPSEYTRYGIEYRCCWAIFGISTKYSITKLNPNPNIYRSNLAIFFPKSKNSALFDFEIGFIRSKNQRKKTSNFIRDILFRLTIWFKFFNIDGG